MQLVGNIEDLGLGEILQIVSFSRKSGTLILNSRKREGCIVFKNGQVIRASASTIKEGICDVLVKDKALAPPQLAKARGIQDSRGFKESLGTILIKDLGIPGQVVEDTASKHIEKIIYSLFLWYEGSFVFELGDFIETPDMLKNDSIHYTLGSGMNPQFLAMEGTRLLDEFRREGKASAEQEEPAREEAPLEPVALEETALPSITSKETVLIIDDDPLTRGFIKKQLIETGYKAEAFAQPDSVLKKVRELVNNKERPIVIADMFMPRMDGEGMLGGIELLSHIKRDFPDTAVIIITEHRDQKTEKEVEDLNATSCLIKPKKTQIREDPAASEVVSFIKNLNKTLTEVTQKGQKAEEPSFIMQDYLEGLEGGSFLEPGYPDERVEESKGLRILKEMLSELTRPLSISEVVLLILRFSSEIMSRAVVFAVKKDTIAGLGQFGIELKGEIPDKKVRKMRVPLNEPSILKEAVDRKSTIAKRLDPLPWNDYIVNELGGYQPSEAFVAPIVVQGKVIMLLYGDNLPDGGGIGDTSTLEIFLAQASMTLEKMILEKKLFEAEK